MTERTVLWFLSVMYRFFTCVGGVTVKHVTCESIRRQEEIEGLHGPGPGPGSTDNVRGPGRVQMIANKLDIEHFGLSRAILFSQRKSYF
jgi:hypothetical protein